MKTEELVKTFAEVDDFLEDELQKFITFLIQFGYMANHLTKKGWKLLIEDYLEKNRKDIPQKIFNPSKR